MHRYKFWAVTGFACLLAFVAYAWKPATSSSDLAAWIQALGSIGAIAGAAWISRDQMHLQAVAADVAKRTAHRQRLEVWAQLIDAAAQKAEACEQAACNSSADAAWFDKMSAELETYIAASEKAGTEHLSKYEELAPVVTGIAAMRALRAHVVVERSRHLTEPNWPRTMAQAVAPITPELKKQARVLWRLVEALPI